MTKKLVSYDDATLRLPSVVEDAIGVLQVTTYASGKNYLVGQLVLSSGTLYRVSTAYTSSGAIDLSKFTAVGGGGGASLTVQDENGNVSTTVSQIDFQGAGVTATAGTGEVVVTIPDPAANTLLKWAASTAVVTDELRIAPTGDTIKRIANGTTRASYDATEAALWTVVGNDTADHGSTPNALTGSPVLRAWYKADDIALTDGALISSWPDASGNSIALTAAGALRPVYKVATSVPWLNGHAVARFTGTQVIGNTATGAAAKTQMSFGAVVSWTAPGSQAFLSGTGSGDIRLVLNTNALSAEAGSPLGVALAGPWQITSGVHVLLGVWDGAQVMLYVDGVLLAYMPAAGSVTATSIFLGALNASPAYPLVGDIAEVAIWEAALTPTQIRQVLRGFSYKYALPASPPF